MHSGVVLELEIDHGSSEIEINHASNLKGASA